MFTKRMQRIGSILTVLGLTTLLWGCGNTTPTGVDLQDTLQPAAQDVPSNATEGRPTEWW